MRRKKSTSQTEEGVPLAEPADQTNPDADVPPEMQEVQKSWAKRPDAFGFETVRWADGYAVSLKESDSNREIFVQFGAGTKADQPKAFEQIKKMFKEDYGIYWDPKVQGWAKGLKNGITPLIREDNRKVRAVVEEAFGRAIQLEEEARGPSLSQKFRDRGGITF